MAVKIDIIIFCYTLIKLNKYKPRNRRQKLIERTLRRELNRMTHELAVRVHDHIEKAAVYGVPSDV